MKKFVTLLIIFSTLLPGIIFAQDNPLGQANEAHRGLAGRGITLPTDWSLSIGTWIQMLFGLLGVIFLVLTIYAGLLWMTAGGNTEQVTKAKNILVQAVVGIIIVLSSYAIVYFVLSRLPGGSAALTSADTAASGAGIRSFELEIIIGQIIGVLFGLLGVIFLVLTIYSGYLWMTAGGNADQVEKAKRMLVQGIIGLTILLSAYAITEFVLLRVTEPQAGYMQTSSTHVYIAQ